MIRILLVVTELDRNQSHQSVSHHLQLMSRFSVVGQAHEVPKGTRENSIDYQ